MNTKLSEREIRALIQYHSWEIHEGLQVIDIDYHTARLRQLARFYKIETTTTETK